MKNTDRAITTVIDAGARYGMHPSWSGYGGDLLYFAFEPDRDEADRIRTQSPRPGFEVIPKALSREGGERNLHVTRHRGCSSFLRPDMESEWFKHYRPGEGQIDSVIRVMTQSVDDFANSRELDIDFLKVDTEGTELEVLEGADSQISDNVLGIRTGLYFQVCYKNQRLFPEIHNYLMNKDYFLLNLDYFGRGVPRNSLFRNPDPFSVDDARYGTLIGTDGVWLRNIDWVCQRYGEEAEKFAYATLKYAYFCLLNHAPDVGLDTLLRFVQDRNGHFGPEVVSSSCYRALRRACAEFLGRWRVYPDAQWDLARSMFKTIFGLELEGGNKYWELIQGL